MNEQLRGWMESKLAAYNTVHLGARPFRYGATTTSRFARSRPVILYTRLHVRHAKIRATAIVAQTMKTGFPMRRSLPRRVEFYPAKETFYLANRRRPCRWYTRVCRRCESNYVVCRFVRNHSHDVIARAVVGSLVDKVSGFPLAFLLSLSRIILYHPENIVLYEEFVSAGVIIIIRPSLLISVEFQSMLLSVHQPRLHVPFIDRPSANGRRDLRGLKERKRGGCNDSDNRPEDEKVSPSFPSPIFPPRFREGHDGHVRSTVMREGRASVAMAQSRYGWIMTTFRNPRQSVWSIYHRIARIREIASLKLCAVTSRMSPGMYAPRVCLPRSLVVHGVADPRLSIARTREINRFLDCV